MIDWWNVFTNSLWILGVAAALAILSHADWLASREDAGLRHVLRRLAQRADLSLALAVASVGAGLGVVRLWERILWLLLASGLALFAFRLWLSRRKGRAG
jgi:cytochrome bd-type quinol oxidase subunit 2